MRRRYDFGFIYPLWTRSILRQVGYLLFRKRAVLFSYEDLAPCISYGWVSFFKPSRAVSSWAGEILLLW
jgi:hypothetical protein